MNTPDPQDYYESNPSARWFALASISIATFCVSVTMSAVNIAVPAIAQDFSANAVLVTWVPTAFMLANAIFIVPAGRVADNLGRKRIFLIGMSVFCVSCLMATLAPDIHFLLVTRILQGLGGALAFATGLALVMSIFTRENRGTAIGISAATLYLGLSFGPVLGGWITFQFGWRVVFAFPLVVGTISMIMLLAQLKGEWKNDQPRPMDWYGAIIFSIAAIAMFIGISGFPDTWSLLLLGAGVLVLIYFVYQQLHSPSPLIHFRAILANRVFSRSLMGNICIYWSNYPFVFLFSLYLQFIRDMTPSEAGQIMMLQPMTMAIIAPISGRLSDLFEPRIIATIGTMVMACAFAMLQGIDTETSIVLICLAMITQGLGFGLYTTPNINAALSSMDKTRLGIASAMMNLARVGGNMIGTGMVLLLVAIFIGRVRIESSQFPALMSVISIALGVSLLLTISGSYFSYSRGNIHPEGRGQETTAKKDG